MNFPRKEVKMCAGYGLDTFLRCNQSLFGDGEDVAGLNKHPVQIMSKL